MGWEDSGHVFVLLGPNLAYLVLRLRLCNMRISLRKSHTYGGLFRSHLLRGVCFGPILGSNCSSAKGLCLGRSRLSSEAFLELKIELREFELKKEEDLYKHSPNL